MSSFPFLIRIAEPLTLVIVIMPLPGPARTGVKLNVLLGYRIKQR